MKTRKLVSLLALLLAATLTFSSCALYNFKMFGIGREAKPATYDTPVEVPEGSRLVPFDEMVYERPNVEELKTYMAGMTTQVAGCATIEDLMKIDDEVTKVIEKFYTMSTIADIHSYLDVNDSYYEEEHRFCEEQSVSVGLLVKDFNEAILNSDLADAYRQEIGDYSFELMKTDQLLNSAAVEKLKQEKKLLDADYNKKLATLTLTYEGEEYTLDDIYNTTGDSYALYYTLLSAYYSSNAPWFADTYARMVEIDREIAETLGFSSPVDMNYIARQRDYSAEDALALCETVKEKLVPLLPQVEAHPRANLDISYNQAFAGVPKILKQIDPELEQYWDIMMSYGLNDYEAKAGKQSGIGFTTGLDYYDAAYCYGYWENDLFSATTVIHEFGHFYDNFLHMDPDIDSSYCLDVVEIYSQGLELLAQPYYSEITDMPEAAVQESLRSFLDTFIYQSLLEEFQLRAYELDTISAETLGTLYTQLMYEYGYGDYVITDENGIANNWFTVTHIFDAPFYTISYVTSASVAMQIWHAAQTDQDAAVAAYMKLIKADQGQPFESLLAEAGLKSPFDEAVWDWMADIYTEKFPAA